MSEVEYYEGWWAKNRKSVLSKRKERYESDSRYREKARERSKHARERAIQEKSDAMVVRVPRIRPPEEVYLAGRKVLAYGIEILSRIVGKSRVTVYSWERKGWLPGTMIKSSRGEKLYTAGMIRIVAQAVEKYSKKGLNRGKRRFNGFPMFEEIQAGWAALANGSHKDDDVDLGDLISDTVRMPLVITTEKISVNGNRVDVYTVEMLAREVGRSKYMIPVWESKCLIPPSPIKNSRNWRLYTAEMIMVVKAMIKDALPSLLNPDIIYNKIRDGWIDVGIEAMTLKEWKKILAEKAAAKAAKGRTEIGQRGGSRDPQAAHMSAPEGTEHERSEETGINGGNAGEDTGATGSGSGGEV